MQAMMLPTPPPVASPLLQVLSLDLVITIYGVSVVDVLTAGASFADNKKFSPTTNN